MYQLACSEMAYEEAVNWMSFFFSHHNFKQYDPDAAFPDLGDLGHQSYRSLTDTIKRIAKAESLTLREVARKFALPRTDFMGNVDKVTDACERWYLSEAADGFMLANTAARFEGFLDLVIPKLQRRGLFREDYEADTFRGNLGFPAVANRYSRSTTGK